MTREQLINETRAIIAQANKRLAELTRNDAVEANRPTLQDIADAVDSTKPAFNVVPYAKPPAPPVFPFVRVEMPDGQDNREGWLVGYDREDTEDGRHTQVIPVVRFVDDKPYLHKLAWSRVTFI